MRANSSLWRLAALVLLLVGLSAQAGGGFPSVDTDRELVLYDGREVGAIERGDDVARFAGHNFPVYGSGIDCRDGL